MQILPPKVSVDRLLNNYWKRETNTLVSVSLIITVCACVFVCESEEGKKECVAKISSVSTLLTTQTKSYAQCLC